MSGVPPKCPYCFAGFDHSRQDRVGYLCGSYYGTELEGEFHQSPQCSGDTPSRMSGALKCPEPGCLMLRTNKQSFCPVHGFPCDIPLTWKNLADVLVKKTDAFFREIRELKEQAATSEGHDEKLWNWNNLRDEVNALKHLAYTSRVMLQKAASHPSDVRNFLEETKHVEEYADL